MIDMSSKKKAKSKAHTKGTSQTQLMESWPYNHQALYSGHKKRHVKSTRKRSRKKVMWFYDQEYF